MQEIKPPLEKDIQRAIVQYLQTMENLGNLVFIRNNSFSGVVERKNGSRGFVKNNKPGAADLFVFLPKGRAIFLEVKRPMTKSKQKPEQVEFENKVKDLGFEYHVVRSVDDVINLTK